MVTLDEAGRARGWTRLIAPPPALRPFVEFLWTQERPPDVSRRAGWRIVPDVAPHLVVKRIRRIPGDTARPASITGATLVGARSHHVDSDMPTREWTAGVRFRPGSIGALARLPAAELTNRGVPLSALGASGVRVERALGSADGPVDAIAILLAALTDLLRAAAPPDPRVRALIRLVSNRDGDSRMDTPGVRALAGRLGMAERTLRQRCTDGVGLSPVRVVRVCRLHAALAIALDGPAHGGWASIAARSGYFDQSHLIREFGQLLGDSPTGFVARART